MKDKEIQAINKLNNLLPYLNGDFGQEIKNNFEIVVNGINELDQEVKQKTFEVQSKDNVIIQKDNVINLRECELQSRDNVINQQATELQSTKEILVQKLKGELIDTLPKLYPSIYPVTFENWPNDWGRTVINSNDPELIKHWSLFYKQKLVEKLEGELIDTLPKLYPSMYPADFNDWPNDWGRTVINSKNPELIKQWSGTYKQELDEKLKAEKEALISNKDQEIEFLKALLVQKELEKEELLAQKEEEIQDKSFIKNLTINSLLEELIIKYTENNNLKMLNLLKQIEIQENKEVIAQKDTELLIKNFLIDIQQDEVELREDEIADLKLLNQQLLYVDLGIQMTGNEESTQVNEIDLVGHHLESQSDFELI
jgi:hypothetical protein